MNRILLVEDSPVTQSIVRSALKEVCEVETADCVAAATVAIEAGAYDLIILDINLPDGDGFQVYEKVRSIERFKLTPILFLTARVEREDKVRGFTLGADDYIVKPFDVVELRVRISAKLKNLQARENSVDNFVLGPFEVKAGSQKISLKHKSGEETKLELTANQFKVLYYLLRNEDKIVTRAELLREVWGDGVHVSDRTIDTHVYAIRRLLGEFSKSIHSVHGQGYRFSLKPGAQKQSA
jgi:DNA-binding response OmpR family regulator